MRSASLRCQALVACAVILSAHVAAALEAQRLVRLLQSMSTNAAQSQHLAARRLQQATGTYPFVTANAVNNSQCLPKYSGGCTYNPEIVLTNAAPEPESESGSLLTKATALGRICGAHASKAACIADEANGCAVDIVQGPGAGNATMVQTCFVTFEKINDLAFSYSLCPGSMADKFFTCTGLKDGSLSGVSSTSTYTSCSAVNGVSCKSSSDGVCYNSDLDSVYSLTSLGQASLLADISNFSPKFWGCCPGLKYSQLSYSCGKLTDEQSCTAEANKCEWDLRLEGCLLNPQTLRDFMIDAKTPLAAFVNQAEATCAAFSDAKTCISQPSILANISSAKVTKFAAATITPGGGACEKGGGGAGSGSLSLRASGLSAFASALATALLLGAVLH